MHTHIFLDTNDNQSIAVEYRYDKKERNIAHALCSQSSKGRQTPRLSDAHMGTIILLLLLAGKVKMLFFGREGGNVFFMYLLLRHPLFLSFLVLVFLFPFSQSPLLFHSLNAFVFVSASLSEMQNYHILYPSVSLIPLQESESGKTNSTGIGTRVGEFDVRIGIRIRNFKSGHIHIFKFFKLGIKGLGLESD